MTYTISQVATLLGRHPAFIRRLCGAGQLSADEASKPGHDWLLTDAGLARLRDWPRAGWRKGRVRKAS